MGKLTNLIVWTEKEHVNIKEIDDQHEKFVIIINELYITLGSDRRWKTESLIKELLELTKEHFETEERLMKENNFTGFYSHKLEHDRFLNKFYTFKRAFDSGNENVSLLFLQSLKTWLINHIELNDRKCGEFLQSLGQK